jgi:hypothetical protein
VARESGGEGRQHARQVRLGAAGRERAGRRRRQPDALAEERERAPLDVRRGGAVPPGSELRVVDGGQRLRDDTGFRDARHEQPEVARVRGVEASLLEQVRRLLDQVGQGARRLEVIGRESRGQLGLRQLRRDRSPPHRRVPPRPSSRHPGQLSFHGPVIAGSVFGFHRIDFGSEARS